MITTFIICFKSNVFRSPAGFPPSSPDCHQLRQSRGLLLFKETAWDVPLANSLEAMMELGKQVADQMSGNVYMHASCVEDECSKVSARSTLEQKSKCLSNAH